MSLSFALVLVLLGALSGLIWLLDALFFARRRKHAGDNGEAKPPPIWVDYARSFFPVILAVLIVRSFIVEPFRIPSGSMMPTLDVGDFILVNKFSYGLRWPVLDSKFLDTGEPERGDVAVFRWPGYTCHRPDGSVVHGGDPACTQPVPAQNWIKRVIGLPGDVITFHDHTLMINGEPVPKYDTVVYQDDGSEESTRMTRSGAVRSEEDLLGVKHAILTVPRMQRSPDGKWVVPQGEYFVMGDNRDNSLDSRYWGFLPEKNLVGEAFLIWFSWRGFGHGVVAFNRIGTVIK